MDKYLSDAWHLLWKKQLILFWLPLLLFIALLAIAVGVLTVTLIDNPAVQELFVTPENFLQDTPGPGSTSRLGEELVQFDWGGTILLVLMVYAAFAGAMLFTESAGLSVREQAAGGLDISAADYFRGMLRCPLRLLGLHIIGLFVYLLLFVFLFLFIRVDAFILLLFFTLFAAIPASVFLTMKFFSLRLHFVTDEAGVFEAFGKSWTFSRGRMFKIFGFLMLYLGIGVGASVLNNGVQTIFTGDLFEVLPAVILLLLLGVIRAFLSTWIDVAKMIFVIEETKALEPVNSSDYMVETPGTV